MSDTNSEIEYFVKFSKFDDNVKNSLREQYAWFSQPTHLNDPYERSLSLTIEINEDNKTYLENYIEKNNLYSKLLEFMKNNLPGSYLQFLGHTQNITGLVNNCGTLVIEYLTYLNTGIFSLANINIFESEAAILMFSHYGDSQKGVSLIYESSKTNHSYVTYLTMPSRIIFSKNITPSPDELVSALYGSIIVTNDNHRYLFTFFDMRESYKQVICRNEQLENWIDQDLKRFIDVGFMNIEEKLRNILLQETTYKVWSPHYNAEEAVVNDNFHKIITGEFNAPFLNKSHLWSYEAESRMFSAPGKNKLKDLGLTLKGILITDYFNDSDLDELQNITKDIKCPSKPFIKQCHMAHNIHRLVESNDHTDNLISSDLIKSWCTG